MKLTGYERVKAYRQAIKKRLVEAFGGKCGKCGYNKSYNALKFHHLDPDGKDFTIRKAIRRWDIIVKEVRKCVCLCGNCHDEYHEGLWEIPDDITRFDEKYAVRKVVIPTYCKQCGKEKKNRGQYCSYQCAMAARQSDAWDDIDLKALLKQHFSYSAIGRMVGVTGNAVKKRAKKLGLV